MLAVMLAAVLLAGPVNAAAPAIKPVPILKEDQPGRTRPATCRIDEGKPARCLFTAIFGDGSFQIDLAGNRSLRVIVNKDEASLFEVLSPTKRVALWSSYRRDQAQRACWVTDAADVTPRRVCVY